MDTSLSAKDIRDAFFDEIYELGRKDKNLIFITDDLDAFGLRKFKKDLPEQFINIGVAEQNMIDVAAGLATCGKKVYVYGICSYVTMRCFEQIKFSVCGMNLPVAIVGVGAGFSFSFDGPTHHGTEDVAVMRTLPEVAIYNPADAVSAAAAAHAAYAAPGPIYVRLDKGVFPAVYTAGEDVSAGYKIVKPLQKINLVSTGFMTSRCLAAHAELAAAGVAVGVVDIFRLKPLADDFSAKVLGASDTVVTVEENSGVGGLGSAIADLVTAEGLSCRLKKIAAPDAQLAWYGSRDWFHAKTGLDAKAICATVMSAQPR